MSTPYSRQPEAVAAVRKFLISVRDRPEADMPRYGEVAAVYGGIARAVAPVLNSVARDCALAGEPDLSALVVLADNGLPGRLNGEVLNASDRSSICLAGGAEAHPTPDMAGSVLVGSRSSHCGVVARQQSAGALRPRSAGGGRRGWRRLRGRGEEEAVVAERQLVQA